AWFTQWLPYIPEDLPPSIIESYIIRPSLRKILISPTKISEFLQYYMLEIQHPHNLLLWTTISNCGNISILDILTTPTTLPTLHAALITTDETTRLSALALLCRAPIQPPGLLLEFITYNMLEATNSDAFNRQCVSLIKVVNGGWQAEVVQRFAKQVHKGLTRNVLMVALLYLEVAAYVLDIERLSPVVEILVDVLIGCWNEEPRRKVVSMLTSWKSEGKVGLQWIGRVRDEARILVTAKKTIDVLRGVDVWRLVAVVDGISICIDELVSILIADIEEIEKTDLVNAVSNNHVMHGALTSILTIFETQTSKVSELKSTLLPLLNRSIHISQQFFKDIRTQISESDFQELDEDECSNMRAMCIHVCWRSLKSAITLLCLMYQKVVVGQEAEIEAVYRLFKDLLDIRHWGVAVTVHENLTMFFKMLRGCVLSDVCMPDKWGDRIIEGLESRVVERIDHRYAGNARIILSVANSAENGGTRIVLDRIMPRLIETAMSRLDYETTNYQMREIIKINAFVILHWIVHDANTGSMISAGDIFSLVISELDSESKNVRNGALSLFSTAMSRFLGVSGGYKSSVIFKNEQLIQTIFEKLIRYSHSKSLHEFLSSSSIFPILTLTGHLPPSVSKKFLKVLKSIAMSSPVMQIRKLAAKTYMQLLPTNAHVEHCISILSSLSQKCSQNGIHGSLSMIESSLTHRDEKCDFENIREVVESLRWIETGNCNFSGIASSYARKSRLNAQLNASRDKALSDAVQNKLVNDDESVQWTLDWIKFNWDNLQTLEKTEILVAVLSFLITQSFPSHLLYSVTLFLLEKLTLCPIHVNEQ
ncbi:hypothetical protein HK096_004421, partial [Nowakowskiella sp. JEL0078]